MEASIPIDERARMRRYLASMGTARHKRQLAGAAGFHRFEQSTAKTIRRVFAYLPFLLVAWGIRAARRRLRRAC